MLIVSVLQSTVAGLVKSFTSTYVSYITMEFIDTFVGSGSYSAAYILGKRYINKFGFNYKKPCRLWVRLNCLKRRTCYIKLFVVGA